VRCYNDLTSGTLSSTTGRPGPADQRGIDFDVSRASAFFCGSTSRVPREGQFYLCRPAAFLRELPRLVGVGCGRLSYYTEYSARLSPSRG